MKRSILVLLIISLIGISAAGIDYDCGDINNDSAINILDALFLINYFYKDGPPPVYPSLADVNNSGSLNLLDATTLIDYLYKSGEMLDCPEIGPTPAINVTGASGCNIFTGGKSLVPPDQDCMYYDYNGVNGTLFLTHANAGFNCCPGEIVAEMSVSNDTIFIYESEVYDSLGPCYCLCLFDVDYEISDLAAGEYVIKVIGMYLLDTSDYLVFDVDLNTSPSGNSCVTRTHYPWGYEPMPAGFLVGGAECKSYGAKDDTLEQDCIVYDYDGEGTLNLTHVNDMFNCCPESLYITVNVEDNVISVDEYETDGLCDCICMFDLEYRIINLSPGIYTLNVNNVYYYGSFYSIEPIEFEIDLTSPTSGVYCVDRPYLPWLE